MTEVLLSVGVDLRRDVDEVGRLENARRRIEDADAPATLHDGDAARAVRQAGRIDGRVHAGSDAAHAEGVAGVADRDGDILE